MQIPCTFLLKGKVLLMLFFGSIGNSMGLVTTALSAKGITALFCWGLILYTLHLSILFVVGKRILNVEISDLLLASNANIGNHATASSLAGMPRLMLVPSIFKYLLRALINPSPIV